MLSEDQIQYLFTFCKRHYVRYFDVQMELVDHLANAVELKMKTDPKISFDCALEKVYRSFGVMGFSTIVREKEKQASRQFWTLFGNTAKKQVNTKKISILFVAGTTFYLFFQYLPFLSAWLHLFIILAGTAYSLVKLFSFSRWLKQTGKKFIMTSSASPVFSLACLPGYLYAYSYIFSEKIELFPSLSVPLVTFLLCIYIAFTYVNLEVLKSLERTITDNYLMHTFPGTL